MQKSSSWVNIRRIDGDSLSFYCKNCFFGMSCLKRLFYDVFYVDTYPIDL